MLKAYYVFSDLVEYCLLVYAPDANVARYLGFQDVMGDSVEYIEVRARRVPEYDQYVDPDYGGTPYVIDSNGYLPADAPDFYTIEI